MPGDQPQSPTKPPSSSQPSEAGPQTPQEQSNTTGSSSTAKSEQEKQVEKQEQSYRVMGVVPMFGTTDRQDASPLTGEEKFKLFARSAFDPVNLS